MDQYTLSCPGLQLALAPPDPIPPAPLRHAQQGCPHCLEALMRQHDPLVHWVIRRFGTHPLNYDEALQAGRLGLWQALLHFDPTRGTAFSSYAVPAIRRAIRREGRRFQRFWRPLPELTAVDAPDPLEVAVAAIERQRLHQAVQAWIDRLPARQATLLRARYGLHGHPPQLLRTLAQAHGVTRQRVQQLLAEAQLCLALPVFSWELRRLLGHTARTELQAALRAWRRFRKQQRRPARRRRRAR
jgi:RNA polymerase sigma factor (sigma-70 family)